MSDRRYEDRSDVVGDRDTYWGRLIGNRNVLADLIGLQFDLLFTIIYAIR